MTAPHTRIFIAARSLTACFPALPPNGTRRQPRPLTTVRRGHCKSLCLMLLSAHSDLPERVTSLCGVYKQHSSGRHGPIFVNTRKGIYLFAVATDTWEIGTRVGGSAVARARRSRPLAGANEWSVQVRGKMKQYELTCRELTTSDGEAPPADAVTVTAAKWDTVAGIYVRQPGGADAVYANEADKTFLWCSRGRWCISRSPEPSAEAASEALAASALSTCASPEDADWSASGLLVLGVEHLAVGKNDREAPPPADASVVPYADERFIADVPSLGKHAQVSANEGWDRAMWRRALALSSPDQEPPLHLLDPIAAAHAGASSAPPPRLLLRRLLLFGVVCITLRRWARRGRVPERSPNAALFAENVFANSRTSPVHGRPPSRWRGRKRWCRLTVDDTVPCRPCECRTRASCSPVRWGANAVLLIEKALAKLAVTQPRRRPRAAPLSPSPDAKTSAPTRALRARRFGTRGPSRQIRRTRRAPPSARSSESTRIANSSLRSSSSFSRKRTRWVTCWSRQSARREAAWREVVSAREAEGGWRRWCGSRWRGQTARRPGERRVVSCGARA